MKLLFKIEPDASALANYTQACLTQGATKKCRLSLLTNSALVYEPQGGEIGGVAGSQPLR